MYAEILDSNGHAIVAGVFVKRLDKSGVNMDDFYSEILPIKQHPSESAV